MLQNLPTAAAKTSRTLKSMSPGKPFSKAIYKGIAMNKVTLELTFGLNDFLFEDETRLKLAKQLLPELRDLDEVVRADRTEDLNPEANSKPGFATVIGFLTAVITFENLTKFIEWLSDRLKDKPIKLSVKVGDEEINLEASSRQELEELERIALRLRNQLKG